MDGLLVVDKPIGPTSHDIVARVRSVLGERRIGHTGTLDPMASGVLALVLGRATRLARFLSAADKTYEAEIRFGVATDTYDARGARTHDASGGPMPSRERIDHAIDAFRGTFMQQPPAYSAKKIAGTRSYTLARRTRQDASALLTRPAPPALPAPASVTARAIDILSVEGDRVTLRVDCSAGFYVRSLAHDLGGQLGIGAHVSALRRTRSGDFTLAGAITAAAMEQDPQAAARLVIPMAAMLPGLSAATLTESGERLVAHGRDLGPADVRELTAASGPGGPASIRLIDRNGRLLGIAEPAGPPGILHPSVVLM